MGVGASLPCLTVTEISTWQPCSLQNKVAYGLFIVVRFFYVPAWHKNINRLCTLEDTLLKTLCLEDSIFVRRITYRKILLDLFLIASGVKISFSLGSQCVVEPPKRAPSSEFNYSRTVLVINN